MSDKLKMVSEKEAYKLVMEALNLGEDEKRRLNTLLTFLAAANGASA